MRYSSATVIDPGDNPGGDKIKRNRFGRLLFWEDKQHLLSICRHSVGAGLNGLACVLLYAGEV